MTLYDHEIIVIKHSFNVLKHNFAFHYQCVCRDLDVGVFLKKNSIMITVCIFDANREKREPKIVHCQRIVDTIEVVNFPSLEDIGHLRGIGLPKSNRPGITTFNFFHYWDRGN